MGESPFQNTLVAVWEGRLSATGGAMQLRGGVAFSRAKMDDKQR
jgi:hypothetical protein